MKIDEVRSTIRRVHAPPYELRFFLIEAVDKGFIAHCLNTGHSDSHKRIAKDYKKALTEVILKNDALVINSIYSINSRKDVLLQVDEISEI